jgi:hypothetical protein
MIYLLPLASLALQDSGIPRWVAMKIFKKPHKKPITCAFCVTFWISVYLNRNELIDFNLILSLSLAFITSIIDAIRNKLQ